MISKEEKYYMPINPKTVFNSIIFPSHPAATSSHPPRRPTPKNWQQKVMAALRIVFSLIRTIAARLKGHWNFVTTGFFKRKQSTDDLTDPMLPRVPSTSRMQSTRRLQLEPEYPLTTQNLDYLPDLSYQQDEDEPVESCYDQASSQQPLESDDIAFFSSPD